MRKYFKSVEKVKRKSESRTRRMQEEARKRKLEILNSPEGKAALEKIRITSVIVERLTL